MKRASLAGGCLTLFLAACTSPGTSSDGSGGSGAGTGGGASGGATGSGGGSSTGGATGTGGLVGTGGTVGMTGGTTGSGGAAGAKGTGDTMGTGGTGGTGGTVGMTGGTTGSGGAAGAKGTGGTTGTGGTSTGGAGGSASAEPMLITSGQGAYWQTATWTVVTSGTADVTVNDTNTLQTWNGFGGTFNEMGWNVLSMLSASDKATALTLLFDAQNGAHFVYGRIPIGASDYAMSRYTDDDISSGTDYTMASFSITRDEQYLIPYIKAALAINPNLHLWASPWTPPAWMKTNSGSVNGTSCALSGNTAYDGGCMVNDPKILAAHALYLSRWVTAYAGQGIAIEAIHHQNEPGYSTPYPSCLWTPGLYDTFISTYLGPELASQNPTTQVYLGTMSNDDAGEDGTIITTVTGDSAAMKYVKGFGLQWNMLPVVSSLTSKNLPIIQSEHKCGNYPWNPAGLPAFNPNMAPNDYPYAVESWGYITSWIQAGVNVYSAWNMVLDTIGKNLNVAQPWPQNALLTVNTSSKTLTPTPAYYVFRHVSQYVDPGAKVVGTTGGDALAFKNPDGTLVAIVHNTATAAKTMIVAIGGKKLQFSVPANGFATVNPQ
jgi:glucosylceramidase